ncbi:MAG: hypothetical protein ACI9MC_003015 [Kiritimatiellia bacterium]|jgi:hypothetical protein
MRYPASTLLLVACGGSNPSMSWTGGELSRDGEPELGLIGVANLDDDDQDGLPDFDDDNVDNDNDRTELTIDAGKKGGTLALAGEGVRIWRDGSIWLEDGESADLEGKELLDVHVEFEQPMDHGVLTLTPKKGDALALDLWAAPALMNHHLQQTERVWALSVSDGAGWNNAKLIGKLQKLLGDKYTDVPGPQYSCDVWMQDEWEATTTTGPAHRMDVVLDSIRDGGGDPDWPGLTEMPADFLEAPDVARIVRGSGYATTYDSTGNLEVSPPLGDQHPFGRIYYGSKGDDGMAQGMREFLHQQRLQDPYEIDTTWLCVGHVDEFMTFVPDPSAPRGFRFLFTDTSLGWKIIESMPGTTTLPKYRSKPPYGHGYATPAAILADNALRSYNDRLQSTHLDPIREQMRTELGLSDEEVVLVPGVFEEFVDESWGPCGAVALVPGTSNLLVLNDGDQTQVVMPDPFLRSNSSDQTGDPMIEAWTELLPSTIETHFVDDWSVYHMGLGEVHCGTNQFRTPTESWWTAAAPLMEAQ